jgi:peptidoglycan/LPS O-acetylase OafA/YrhL
LLNPIGVGAAAGTVPVHWDDLAGLILVAGGALVCGKQLLCLRAARRQPAPRSDLSAQLLAVGIANVVLGCLFLTGEIANAAFRWPFLVAGCLLLIWLVTTDLQGWRRSRRQRRPDGPAAAPGD